MAQRTIVEFTDDLNGKPAAETVTFSLDGKTYEIDVTDKNAAKLRQAFEPWTESARRLTKSGRTIRKVATDVDTAAVRAWAASNGIEVSARGRISSTVLEQYRAAGN
ncbi:MULTISPECIES: Lsr2 family protein [Kineosporia]|uniref:Lsr2 family protein n=1 Tax=Kineosporia mesophila TaxID=566012 RepID=A0ABP7AN97_9ACTN|nr:MULTISPECIES: Lsr2 family protein [Kineosporia]MCD5349321.1 Lsr2 family protein [Kineosporia mesophila]GLY28741.1 Lsr2 family protein [Kineosporia sp. NBRC 101731]